MCIVSILLTCISLIDCIAHHGNEMKSTNAAHKAV